MVGGMVTLCNAVEKEDRSTAQVRPHPPPLTALLRATGRRMPHPTFALAGKTSRKLRTPEGQRRAVRAGAIASQTFI